MNLRISEGQLRFRISREELEILLGGSSLSLSFPLGAQGMSYVVEMTKQQEPLMIEIKPQQWILRVDESTLMQFAASLPSREGIDHDVAMEGAQLKLALEVDVRRKR